MTREENDMCPIKFKIIVNGKCVVCGKDLTEDRIFICEECAKKAESEDKDADNN